jgi:hypothetical protein
MDTGTGTATVVRIQAAFSGDFDTSAKCTDCRGVMKERPNLWVRAIPDDRNVVVSLTNVPTLVCAGDCPTVQLSEGVVAKIHEIEQALATAARSSQGITGLTLDPGLAVVEKVPPVS